MKADAKIGDEIQRWVSEVDSIAYSNAHDVFEDVNGSGATLKPWKNIDGRVVAGAKTRVSRDGTTVEITLHDKMKALDLKGKHLGLFTENLNLKGATPIVIKNMAGEVVNEIGIGEANEETAD